jgi:hypothetical protein
VQLVPPENVPAVLLAGAGDVPDPAGPEPPDVVGGAPVPDPDEPLLVAPPVEL